MRNTPSLRVRLLRAAIVLLLLLILQVAQLGAILVANTTPGAPLGCGPAPLPYGLGQIEWLEYHVEVYCHA